MATQRKEVQAHGFSWEKELIKNVYRATCEDIPYTSKMDLPGAFNDLDGCDLSIKTSGSKNAVCMADCLRVFDAVTSGTPFHLVVVHYTQEDATQTKKVSGIVEIDLTDAHELLFGTLTRSQVEELDKAIKAIPQKRKPTAEEHAALYALRNALQSQSGAIRLDIKCNSTQSRLQCSFNRFQPFLERIATRIIAKSSTHEFRGSSISAEIASSRRVFKKTV